MQRRELLGLLSVGVAGLAGCGGSSDDAPPTVDNDDTETAGDVPNDASMPVYPFNTGSADEFEFEESDEGTAIIRVPVENTRDKPYTARLSLTVLVDGERQTLSRTIQLDGGERRMVSVEVDTAWEDWRPNFQDISFSQGTPVDN